MRNDNPYTLIPVITKCPHDLQALRIRKGTDTSPNSIPATWVMALTFSSLSSNSGLHVFMTNCLYLSISIKILYQHLVAEVSERKGIESAALRLEIINGELLSSGEFMIAFGKKTLVILPVIVLSLFFLRAHAYDYRHLASKRLVLLILSLLVLYGGILISVITWRQKSVMMMCVQSGFLVYVFMVLTLTGYFILFREISTHGWWVNMHWRIDHNDHVNLVPFQVFKIYRLTDKQIVGNFFRAGAVCNCVSGANQFSPP